MNTIQARSLSELKQQRSAPLATPGDLAPEATRAIASGLNGTLSDVFALYRESAALYLGRPSGSSSPDKTVLITPTYGVSTSAANQGGITSERTTVSAMSSSFTRRSFLGSELP